MTDRRRDEQIHPSRSAYMHYIHTTKMARRHERQIQLAQLDEEIRRNETMMLKRQHDSRMRTGQAIRELRLEQERRLIKEEQRRHEHEERRRIHRQNREQLERELQRKKNELRAELTKEEIKCQKADEGKERVQHKEEERKRLRVTQEKVLCLKQIKGRQPAVELKAQEQKQRIKDKQSTSTGQENEIVQDETEEEQRKVDVRENENGTHMEQDERSNEEEGTEVQRDYSNDNSNTDSMSSDDTVQQDCRCSSVIFYGQLETSRVQTTTLEVLQNTDRQEMFVDHTLDVCIAQECTSDDIIQSDCAPANLSDEQLQVSGTKITSLKVHHDTELQNKAMQRTLWMYIAQECASDTQVPSSLIQLKILLGGSEIRNIVYAELIYIGRTCKNSCLCFKFLWWQDSLLLS